MDLNNLTEKEKKELFLEVVADADNVYRTKQFIVKQQLSLHYDEDTFNESVSEDTFYFRTKELDYLYEKYMSFLMNIEGKRIKTGMSSRRYVYKI